MSLVGLADCNGVYQVAAVHWSFDLQRNSVVEDEVGDMKVGAVGDLHSSADDDANVVGADGVPVSGNGCICGVFDGDTDLACCCTGKFTINGECGAIDWRGICAA